MIRLAGPRLRAGMMAAVMIPLWSSYLARVYAWRLILSHDGVLNWALSAIGLPGMHIGYSNWAMWIVFSYLWLPFMILPVAAAVERIPPSLLEASADLGSHGLATFRRIVLPMALPGMVAGAISTFSLTLGDYVTPMLVGGEGSDFIGNVVYSNVGVTNNIPFAAAYAVLPLGVMGVFLLVARKMGAFDAL
jgi:putative spermidine/putrescine transport system permease protein